MTFRGWPPAAIEFFEGIEADNTKTFWLAHKDLYEREVRAPMELLLEELAPEFGDAKIFRPYRDVRFSRDKSPYKTNIAATIGNGYISLSSQGLGAGGGMYHMAADQLTRYRDAIAADGSGRALQRLVDTIRKAKVDIHGSDPLKTIPKGYDKDHERAEFLRFKGIVAMKMWPVSAWLSTAAAKKRIVDAFHTMQPLVAWLEDNVGPSTLTPPDRR